MAEELVTPKEIKVLPITTKTFTANGITYRVAETMTIARYKVYQKFQIEAGYHTDFLSMFQNWRKIYELVNAMKFADAAVLAHNVMNGVVNLDNNEVYSVRFCTLFINAEGEDITVYDQQVMDKKISDWEAEGINIGFFLTLSSALIKGFLDVYKELTRATSNQVENE